MERYDIAIIGTGPAGVSAAITAKVRGKRLILFGAKAMSDKVEKLTGVRPTLFRPPYGEYNNSVIRTVRSAGYEAVQWSVDSLDWKNISPQDMIRRAGKVSKGDIILFHNDSQYLLDALPTLLQSYKEQGLQMVKVSDILLEGETTIDVQGKQHPLAAKE